jgi:hypothetical protein
MKNETVSHVETKLNHSMYFSSHTLLISQIKIYKLSVLLKAKIWTSTTCSGIVFCTPICNKTEYACQSSSGSLPDSHTAAGSILGSPCETCGEQSGNGADFCEYFG